MEPKDRPLCRLKGAGIDERTDIEADTLPEPLFRMVRADKVRVREADGVIIMTPLEEAFDCTAEVFGMYANGKLSVDQFLGQKYKETLF